MSEATAKAPQIERHAPEPTPAPKTPETGIAAWLQTWRQVLIAEVLSVLERRRCD